MAHRDLVGFSRQALYELEMVEHLAKRQVDLILGSVRPEWRERLGSGPLTQAWFEQNAIAESFLIHVRNLAAFLYRTRRSPQQAEARRKRGKAGAADDAYAEDYFPDPIEDWRKLRGKRPKIVSDDAINTISREIGHMTYERAAFKSGGTKFEPYGMYTALAEPMDLFATLVDPAMVADDFRQRVADAMPMQRPQTPVPVFPVATQAMPPSR